LAAAGRSVLVIVDFSAGWCGPCSMMEPVLQAMAAELTPRALFVKVDGEVSAANRGLMAECDIR
jgi:thiol-disulfide isomerase/thioredoxin